MDQADYELVEGVGSIGNPSCSRCALYTKGRPDWGIKACGTKGYYVKKESKPSTYNRTIYGKKADGTPGYLIVDIYNVFDAFDVPAYLANPIKKCLAKGSRGVKNSLQDLREARDGLSRVIEIEEAKLDLS